MAYIIWLTSSNYFSVFKLCNSNSATTSSPRRYAYSVSWGILTFPSVMRAERWSSSSGLLELLPIFQLRLIIWGVMVRNWNSIPRQRRYSVNTLFRWRMLNIVHTTGIVWMPVLYWSVMNGNAFVSAGTKGSFCILSIFYRYANSKTNLRLSSYIE